MTNRAIGIVTKIQGTFKTTRSTFSKFKSFSSRSLYLDPKKLESYAREYEKVIYMDDAMDWFHRALYNRPINCGYTFIPYLELMTEIEKFSYVIDCFKQMLAVGVRVNKYTANIVMKCYSRLHQTEHGGFSLLGCCWKKGVVLHMDTYNTLIKGLILEEKTHEAERLFKTLIKTNQPLNIVTYNNMIKGLCKIGSNITAIGLIRFMEGRGCKPNLDTYNMVIDRLCKDLMIDDAFKLLKGMFSHKFVAPNLATYNSLIHALCKLGRWDDVSRMLKQMEDERISPDIDIFDAIVDALCKQGNIKEAEFVIDVMYENFDMHVNTETVNSLIHGHCLRREMARASTHFNRLGQRRDVDSYNIMIDGYCRDLQHDKAFAFYNSELAGSEPETNKVAGIIVSMGYMLNTIRVLRARIARDKKLESQEVEISRGHPYVYFLQNWTTYEESLVLFRFMEGHNSKLNKHIEVYNILIFGAIKRGKFDFARSLFHDVYVKGLQPDVVTYTMMIIGFFRRGLLKDANNLLSEMLKSSDCDTELIHANYNMVDVLKVLEWARGAVAEPTGNTYGDMIEIFLHERSSIAC